MREYPLCLSQALLRPNLLLAFSRAAHDEEDTGQEEALPMGSLLGLHQKLGLLRFCAPPLSRLHGAMRVNKTKPAHFSLRSALPYDSPYALRSLGRATCVQACQPCLA